MDYKLDHIKTFLGRGDVLAKGYLRSTGRVGYKPVKIKNEKHLNQLLQDHLDGKDTYGTYVLNERNNCRFMAIDVDDPDDLTRALKICNEVQDKARLLGFDPAIEFSGSKGYHLWFIFEEEIPTEIAHKLGKIICSLSLYPDLEVFPKQIELTKDKPFGNLIKLPFGRHPKTQKLAELRTKLDKDKKVKKLGAKVSTALINKVIQDNQDVLDYEPKKNVKDKTDHCIKQMLLGVAESKPSRKEAALCLACYYKAHKVALEEHLMLWNEKNSPPLDKDELEEVMQDSIDKPWTCETIRAKMGVFCDKKKCVKGNIKEAEERIQPRTVQFLLEKNFEEQPWLINKFIPTKSVTFICGYPKSYKTMFCLNLAWKLASEKSRFLGYETADCKVMYWQQEISDQALADRIRLITGDEAVKNLNYIPYTGKDLLNLCNEKNQQDIERFIRRYRPDVIFIDPLRKFLGGYDENSSTQMQAISDFCDAMKVQYGVSWIIVHHARKPNQYDSSAGDLVAVNLNSLRGSSVLSGWGDCYFFLNNPRSEAQPCVDISFVLRYAEELPKMRLTLDRTNLHFKLNVDIDTIISYIRTHKEVTRKDLLKAFQGWRTPKRVADLYNQAIRSKEILWNKDTKTFTYNFNYDENGDLFT